jgi:hypothetical protein
MLSVLGVFRRMFQVFHLDIAHVAMALPHVSISMFFKCFICFILMLQVFHLDVAKVDLDVAYVAMPIHVCFKYFICFRRMLQIFHLDVLKVDQGVAQYRWLADNSLPQPTIVAARAQSWVNPCGFPVWAWRRGPATDTGA